MTERVCEGCRGRCPHCTGSMKGKRKDADFCCKKCYWRTYSRERLQPLRRALRRRRRASDGAHGEHGTRVYFATVEELGEWKPLTLRAQEKWMQAHERIEKA